MGVYNNVTISTSLEDRVNTLVAYLNNLEGVSAERISETYNENEYLGARFYFTGADISGFFGYSEDMKYTYTWLVNGEAYLLSPNLRGGSSAGNLTIHSFVAEDCILITLYDSHTSPDGMELMLVDTENSAKLIGYVRLTTAAFADISTLVYENTADVSRIQYTYTNMFPYSAIAGMLDFLSQAYFINTGIRRFKTAALKECSTVPLLSTVTLPPPLNNHLAIGTHCVVQLTEGGNE